jgi:nitrogen fixation NifU-like protein
MLNADHLHELYQELILDHGTHPRNHHAMLDATHTAEGFNPLCGDRVQVYLHIDALSQKILSASFTGQGCAISTASASLLIEALPGKTLQEAQTLLQTFQQFLTEEHSTPQDNLGKLSALAGVRAFPMRIKCATLASHTLEESLRRS